MSFWRQDVVQPILDRDVDACVAEQLAILRCDPGNARAHFALGTLAQFRGDSASAIAYFRKAIELDPTTAAPHVSLGRIHAVTGDSDLAWRHARAAKQLGDSSLVEQLERYPNALPSGPE